MKLTKEEINIIIDSLNLLKAQYQIDINLEFDGEVKDNLLDTSEKITYIKAKLIDAL